MRANRIAIVALLATTTACAGQEATVASSTAGQQRLPPSAGRPKAVVPSTNPCASRTGPQVSVKDFGAVGDGATDDSGAIQAAIGSVTAGGTVVLPAGTYLLGARLRVAASNVWIVGAGSSSTVLRVRDGTSVNAIEFNDPSTGGANASTISDVGACGFTVDGNRANQVDGGTDESQEGIILTKVVRGHFDDIAVKDVIYDGFSINIESSDISIGRLLTTNCGRTTDYGGLLLSATVSRVFVANHVSVNDTIAVWLIHNANDNNIQTTVTDGRNAVVIDNSLRNVVAIQAVRGAGTGVTIQDGIGIASGNLVFGNTSGYATQVALATNDQTNRVLCH